MVDFSPLKSALADYFAHPEVQRRLANVGKVGKFLTPGPLEIGQLASPALKASSMQGDFGRTDALLGKQSAGMTPNAYVGKAFDTDRYYPSLPQNQPQPQGPPASAAWSQQPMGTINPHPVMKQPIAAPGPVGPPTQQVPSMVAGGGSMLPFYGPHGGGSGLPVPPMPAMAPQVAQAPQGPPAPPQANPSVPGMPFNAYAGMPPQSNPTAPGVGDPRMTTGGPDLINKMLAYFQNKQAPS